MQSTRLHKDRNEAVASSSWNKHFRGVSEREKNKKRADFGALGLVKTAADLRDLVTAKDALMAHLREQMHPPIAADILADFAALDQRYAAARQFALPMLNYTGQSVTPGFVEGLTSAKNEYDGILKALSQGYPSQHTIKGDLQDITRRLGMAYQPGPPAPQPGQRPADILFKAGDTAAKYMPDPLKAAVAWLDPGLVPQNANAPSYKAAQEKVAKIADYMTPILMVGVAVGALVLVTSIRKS